MELSLKIGFAQIFSCCPKNLSCPKFWGGGGCSPPRPARPVRPRSIKKEKKESRVCVNRLEEKKKRRLCRSCGNRRLIPSRYVKFHKT